MADMKKVNDYIQSLTTEQLVNAYRDEYLVFKETGIYPDGVIRTIDKLLREIMGSNQIDYAMHLFNQRCAEIFYEQNTKQS